MGHFAKKGGKKGDFLRFWRKKYVPYRLSGLYLAFLQKVFFLELLMKNEEINDNIVSFSFRNDNFGKWQFWSQISPGENGLNLLGVVGVILHNFQMDTSVPHHHSG